MRVALVAVLMVLGAATAQDPVEVDGELRFPDGARLRGTIDVEAERAVLDLSGAAGGVTLAWEAADGYRVSKNLTYVPTPVGTFHAERDPEPPNGTIAWGPGSLRGLTCAPGCEVVLFPDAAGAALGLANASGGPIAWLREEVHFGGYDNRLGDGGSRGSFHVKALPGWAAFEGGEPQAGPTVGVMLWNVTGRVEADGKAERLRTGVDRQPKPMGLSEDAETSYVVLHLRAPRILVEAPGARLWA
ncbi:MAG TPA: hypothetical protein VHH36_09815, partial [Candidatus Thermoplasmatota archaeon]|nr:hypothetical protein [Candidatus Thermoplasmatota archaeon]